MDIVLQVMNMKGRHNLYTAACHYEHGYYLFQWYTNDESELSRSIEPRFICDYIGPSLKRFEHELVEVYIPYAEKLYTQAYTAFRIIEGETYDEKYKSPMYEIYNLIDVFFNGILQYIASGLKVIFEEGIIQLTDVSEEIEELKKLLLFLIKQTCSLRSVVLCKSRNSEKTIYGHNKCLKILDDVEVIQDSFLKDLRLLEKEISNPSNRLVLN